MAVLQTLREGYNYFEFEKTLLNLHLDGLDMGLMNHSVKSIYGFMVNIAFVMDMRLKDHMHGMIALHVGNACLRSQRTRLLNFTGQVMLYAC